MAKTKFYNKDTQKWEYAETGCVPVRGTHYWVAQDLKPLHDYISSRVMATAEVCFLTVMVASNQPDKSAVEGLSLNVTFPDGRTAEVGAGSVISFTEGSVTVQFPEVAGYRRPDNLSVSYRKGSVTETTTYLAEEVTVTSLVDGVASSEYSYEVGGEGIVCLTGSGTSFAGMSKWLVPHGVTMTVTPDSVDGYTSGSVTHTAWSVTGSVSVEWTEIRLPYGVYIQDSTGTWWSPERWDGTATPAFIVIYSEDVPPFGIPILLDVSTRLFTGSEGQGIGYSSDYYFSSCDTQEKALAWTNGVAAAEYVKSRVDSGLSELDTNSAFYMCLYEPFLNGVVPSGRTYPAMLCELNLLYQNKAAVDAVYEVLGYGSQLDSLNGYVWSCTMYHSHLGASAIWTDWWVMNMGTGEMEAADMYGVADSLYYHYLTCVEVVKPDTFVT